MSFEKLRVFQAAELLDQLVTALLPSIKSGHAKDIDPLKRAAPSVCYNIAEAFGSAHNGRKVYHLGIARGSVDETRAVLRKLARTGGLKPALITRPTAVAVTVAKMITAWIDNLKQQG